MLAVFALGFLTADSYLIDFPGPLGGVAESLTDIWNGMIYDSTLAVVKLLAEKLGGEVTAALSGNWLAVSVTLYVDL